METKLNIAYADMAYEKVSLIKPTSFGYVHIAAEVDRRPPFLADSRAKRALLNDCKRLSQSLERRDEVRSATVFKALFIPPGRGKFLKQRPNVHIARFDVVVLIETPTVAEAEALMEDLAFATLEHRVRKTAHYVHKISASNVRQIGAVDHERDGVFLFNYFFADDAEQNLAVWEYTAGWFEKETELDNSTLLMPTKNAESEYPVINHCRWDHLRDILPSLIFKSSFRSYVLGNFEANNTAAIPILYRLA